MIFCLPFINLAFATADPIEDDFLFDVDITSGPTGTVCPGQEYTFTASSSSSGSYLMAGDFKIYPNPAENQLNIELTDNESADNSGALSSESSAKQTFTVLIYNKQQRLMVEDAVSGNKKELDVSALPSDTYLLHIQHKGKTIKEQIVIK